MLAPKEMDPAAAYDLWASGYDSQPGNLMLDLDEALFSSLISAVSIQNKVVADIGCGTGRHWSRIMEKKPAKLLGYDVSAGMLKKLQQKFPDAQTRMLHDHHLEGLGNAEADLVISTLTVAHIENLDQAMAEWTRVLKKGGDMIMTDYHPTALAKGGKRTFSHHNKVIAVKNYVHSIESIIEMAQKNNLLVVNRQEMKIDESTRHYYEKKNALKVYEQFRGTPIIYGLHFRKS